MTKNHSASLDAIPGAMTDAELNCVSGGDKATTTTKGTTKTTTTTKPIVFTLEQVLVSSY